jgi:hypothetical protein
MRKGIHRLREVLEKISDERENVNYQQVSGILFKKKHAIRNNESFRRLSPWNCP